VEPKMESKLLLALLVAALLAFSAASDGDSNGSDSGSEQVGSYERSFEKKDDECDSLVEGADENEGKCDLTDGLEEVSEKCDCDEEQKTKIITWVTMLKQLLKVNVTVEERLTIALSSIQKFQIENSDVYELIQYQNISSWGYLASFSKVIQFRQSTKIESLVTLDDDNNCPLFDALLNGTEDSYEQKSAVKAFINETLIGICGDMSISIKKRSVLIYKAISEFFSINAEWQFSFFQFKIEKFGSFQQFFEITRTYYQVSQVDVVLEGEVEECAFMISFKNQLDFMSSDSSITVSVKATMKQFYLRISEQLKLCGKSGKARLACIVKEMNKFVKLYPTFVSYVYNIQIEGFGSFMDLISCSPWKIGFKPKPTMPSMLTSPKPTCSCTCAPSTTVMA